MILLFNGIPASGEIIGDDYFGRNLELEFKNITGWKNEFIFREKKAAFLPTFKEFNDQFEFECIKGVDASLVARASHHAKIFVRYCDKSFVEEKLKAMETNLKNYQTNDPLLLKLVALSVFSQTQKNVNGVLFKTYHIRAFAIGHGIGFADFTVTISPKSKFAVISWIIFANEEKNCLADVLCKYDEEMMGQFNQVALSNEEKFLTPHLNEFQSHLAYPMVMAQWEQMGILRELVRESRSFELASEKYPEIDGDRAFQTSVFAGQLNKQKDGSYRMYLIMLIKLGDSRISKTVTEDVRNLVLTNFDSYLTNFLASIVEGNN